MPYAGEMQGRRRFDCGHALVGEQDVESGGVGIARGAANASAGFHPGDLKVTLSLATDFENYSVFTPQRPPIKAVNAMIDQVITWSNALAPVRDAVAAA
ncbi:hypothetical protein [Rhodococcus sp. ACT016]|uniref:hypothetical protein n=1 Tax=Rhodococcus sp. ACT016 TaxID=3134808 RepID=UPI003D29A22B